MTKSNSTAWLIDGLVGGALGLLVAGIVAVNVVIYSGIDAGYEAGIGEVFDYNPLVGVAVVAILVLGPVLGILLARARRR
jgi:hypothetical protein